MSNRQAADMTMGCLFLDCARHDISRDSLRQLVITQRI